MNIIFYLITLIYIILYNNNTALTDNYINLFNYNINNAVVNFFSKFKFIFFSLLRIFNNNYQDFIQFLLEKNILQTIIGLLIATQVGLMSSVIINNILSPIINFIVADITKKKNFSEHTYTLLGINFKYGLIVLTSLKVFITFIFVFIIWKFSSSLNAHSNVDSNVYLNVNSNIDSNVNSNVNSNIDSN